VVCGGSALAVEPRPPERPSARTPHDVAPPWGAQKTGFSWPERGYPRPVSHPVLAAVRAFAPTLREASRAIDEGRTLPKPIVRGLAEAGCFRLFVPAAIGGLELAPSAVLDVIEEVARADSAAGWCVMVGSTSGLFAAFLEPAVARALYADPLLVTCGVFAPLGVGVDEGEHVRVSGRWPFASVAEHASYRMGGVVMRGEGPPALRHVLFEAAQTRLVDTWQVSGLRGTGSVDMLVDDVLVPKAWTTSLVSEKPRHDGLLYRFPQFGLLALSITAVAFGVAREAIDAFAQLATAKRPGGSKRTLAERELTQLTMARAEARLTSARALTRETVAEVEEAARQGAVTLAQRARLRLAACHGMEAAADAVGLVYRAAGGTAIYVKCPLERAFRDIHVATQHAMVSDTVLALAGRVLLGLETDAATL
jgi:alkylation response protein AidB-like acyl-CoA dehydrogenase